MVKSVKNDKATLNSDDSNSQIGYPNYDEKIGEIAYFKSESRGFEPGHELSDWLQAEQEYLHRRNEQLEVYM